MSDENEDVGTRYYGTDIDDPLIYGYGNSGYGFNTSSSYNDESVFDPTYGGDLDLVSPDIDIGSWWDSQTEGDQSVLDEILTGGGGDFVGTLKKLAASAGKDGFNRLKKAFTKKDAQGNDTIDWASMATAGIGLYGLANKGSDTGGYNKPVPKMTAVMQQIPYAQDPNRRPGEAGRRYFTDTQFAPQGDAEKLAAAQAAATAQSQGIMAAAPKYAALAPNPYAGLIPLKFNPAAPTTTTTAAAGLPAVPTREQIDMQNQQRTAMPMARGGIADAGRYLRGKTDGMADEIETSIDEEQPALLSHGEFVIPADVVSHLGNGNSEAGAEKLYEMMDRIRVARTGTKEQGKEINPDKFLAAAGGGLAATYVGGGQVQRFNGVTGSDVNATGGNAAAPTATGAAGTPQDVSRTSTLSPWVGDYVTNALGQGAALAAAPYQAYQGPLTAGASNLQQQAFAGASDIASAGYTPGSFTGGFGTTQATQYMNPYLQASLDPQLKELQRQSDIARIADAGRLTKTGAYGGSRQAIMESEGRRNLLDKQAGLIGSGYKTAYDTGLGQFNKEREADEASRQFSANFGLKSVGQLADLGAVERGITSEGLTADRAQFQEERDFAYKMPQYQLGLLSGLPIGSNTTAVNQDAISKLQSDVGGLASLYQTLAKLGQTK